MLNVTQGEGGIGRGRYNPALEVVPLQTWQVRHRATNRAMSRRAEGQKNRRRTSYVVLSRPTCPVSVGLELTLCEDCT